MEKSDGPKYPMCPTSECSFHVACGVGIKRHEVWLMIPDTNKGNHQSALQRSAHCLAANFPNFSTRTRLPPPAYPSVLRTLAVAITPESSVPSGPSRASATVFRSRKPGHAGTVFVTSISPPGTCNAWALQIEMHLTIWFSWTQSLTAMNTPSSAVGTMQQLHPAVGTAPPSHQPTHSIWLTVEIHTISHADEQGIACR